MTPAEAYYTARAREASAESTFRHELALEQAAGQPDAARAEATKRKALALSALVAARGERLACERVFAGGEQAAVTLLSMH